MIAEITAPERKRIPFGSTTSVKSVFSNMIKIPANEIKIPAMFSHDNRSRNTSQAATGVKSGMVAIITEVIVEVVYFNP